MATIYLIRHGQASFGAENYDQLSALGQRQADVTGEYFSRIGVKFDRMYSGDLSRQRETCERVVAHQPESVEHIIDPRFNEIRNDKKSAVIEMENNEELQKVMTEKFITIGWIFDEEA